MEKLFFCTREGEFFSRIYHVVEKRGLYTAQMKEAGKKCRGSGVPGAEVLEVSRMSTFMPSLREISVSEMMRLWDRYPGQSMKALFCSLQVTDKRLWAFLEKYKINADEIMYCPWKDARIRQLFKDKDFIACMEAERDRKRERLYAYFAAKGWEKDCAEAVGIVDIGWKGTIQDNLCCLYPDRKIIGFYIGLQPFVSSQLPNSEKYGFLDGYARQKDILLTVRPLEMLCNSPNGSVTGYAYTENAANEKKKIIDSSGREYVVRKNNRSEGSEYAVRKNNALEGGANAVRKNNALEGGANAVRKNDALEGGVNAVRKNDALEGRVYAVRKNNPSENRVYYEYTASAQKKILEKIQRRCRPKTQMPVCAGSRKKSRFKAQRAVYRFTVYPDRRTVKAYFSLKHNEEFGIGGYVDVKAGRFRPDLLLLAVFTGSGRKRLKAVLKESEWPQGYLVRYWMYLFLYPYNAFLHRYLENKENQKYKKIKNK